MGRTTDRGGQQSALLAEALNGGQTGGIVARWRKGERTVGFLVSRGRLESFEAVDLAALAEARVKRAALQLDVTATAALQMADVDGAYVAVYDAYRMTAEALLARQGLRATGGERAHMAVEHAVSAQFAAGIPAFAKPTFERLRRTRNTAQYFDPRPHRSMRRMLHGRSLRLRQLCLALGRCL